MVWPSQRMYLTVIGVCFCILPGCREEIPRPWQIVVQNRADKWCEVEVSTDPGPNANAPDLGARERRVLRSGSDKLIVHSVKVVYNRKEQVLSPEAELTAGKNYLILVETDGRLHADITNQ